MQNITQLLDVVDNMVPRFVYKKNYVITHFSDYYTCKYNLIEPITPRIVASSPTANPIQLEHIVNSKKSIWHLPSNTAI
jgi:hypothetical protein